VGIIRAVPDIRKSREGPLALMSPDDHSNPPNALTSIS
jgi:hypothetical protein